MKAVYFQAHGGPEVLRAGELADPAPGRGDVLIDVAATSLNHLDLFVRRGAPGIKVALPHVLGSDASGVVTGLGEGATGVAVGERVLVDPTLSCGRCESCVRGDAPLCRRFGVIGEHRWGAYAEKLVIPDRNVIRIPDGVSFETAAAVPLVYVTAWRMLITRGRVKPGEDVLILGAAGGVGVACIQVAKLAGARVFATASSEEKRALCRDLGADVVINYKDEDFVKRVRAETGNRGVDVCVDYVGSDTWARSLKVVASGGRILTCGATTGYEVATDLRHVFYRQLEIIGSTMGNRNDLLAVLKFIFAGRARPVIAKVVELEEVADAHRLMESRDVPGKIVIRIDRHQEARRSSKDHDKRHRKDSV
jgi:NADPH:quinone reductase-like Zn-dependent oxidoreductase